MIAHLIWKNYSSAWEAYAAVFGKTRYRKFYQRPPIRGKAATYE